MDSCEIHQSDSGLVYLTDSLEFRSLRALGARGTMSRVWYSSQGLKSRVDSKGIRINKTWNFSQNFLNTFLILIHPYSSLFILGIYEEDWNEKLQFHINHSHLCIHQDLMVLQLSLMILLDNILIKKNNLLRIFFVENNASLRNTDYTRRSQW